LFSVPDEGFVDVIRSEVRPVIVYDIDVGVDGLDGEKAGETAAATPAYDEIDA
jgi:hypothetical protein